MGEAQQQEQRFRDEGQDAVVGDQLQARTGRLQLGLEFRTQVEGLAQSLGGPGRNGLHGSGGSEPVLIARSGESETELLVFGRHDRRHEMMLKGRNPAVLHWDRQMAVVAAGGEVELAVFGAVVESGSVELRLLGAVVEHRALGAWIVADDLRVLRHLPGRVGMILNGVFDIDAILAPAEDQRLGNGNAVLTGPRERDSHLVAGAKIEFALRRRIGRQMRGGGPRSGQSGLQLVQRARIVDILEANRRRLALHPRVLDQVGALDRAAARADVDIEYVCTDIDHVRGRSGSNLLTGVRRVGNRGVGARHRIGRATRRVGAAAGRCLARLNLGNLIGELCSACTGRTGSRGLDPSDVGDDFRMRAVILHPRLVVEVENRGECDPEVNSDVISHGHDRCTKQREERARLAMGLQGRSAQGRIRRDSRGGSGQAASKTASPHARLRSDARLPRRNSSKRDRNGTSVRAADSM